MPWDCSGYRWKRSFRGWGWKRKALSCPRVLLPWGHALCRRWLRAGCDHTLQMCMGQVLPIASPTAICPFWPEVRCTHHVWGVWCCMQQTWAMKVDTLNRLRRNDRPMIRWICSVRAKDEVSSDSLLTKLGIQDLDVVLRTSRMRWFGHVQRSTGWIAEVRKLNVVAQKRSGRPRKSWDEVLENDSKKLGMDSADPQNRSEWRGRLRERLVQKAQPSVEENRALKWIWWWWYISLWGSWFI